MKQPIGIFDSGVGGLSVAREIMRTLPHESIIYFGDTARVPYGGKSRETIIRYSLENAQFLLEKGIKVLIVACNTASAHAIEELSREVSVPIVEVIKPGAKRAVQVTKNGRIAVLGTKGTILSGQYQKVILELLPSATLFPIACPLFVPLVEEQFIDHPATRLIVKDYLGSLKGKQVDTLLLGCTHYPFLQKVIQEEVGDGVQIVDSATTCAEEVRQLLCEQMEISTTYSSPLRSFFVSDDPEKFQKLCKQLFGENISNVTFSETRNCLSEVINR